MFCRCGHFARDGRAALLRPEQPCHVDPGYPPSRNVAPKWRDLDDQELVPQSQVLEQALAARLDGCVGLRGTATLRQASSGQFGPTDRMISEFAPRSGFRYPHVRLKDVPGASALLVGTTSVRSDPPRRPQCGVTHILCAFGGIAC